MLHAERGYLATDSLTRILAEQAAAAKELAAGAKDVRGLRQCITDWVAEEVIIFAAESD
jgi:hypothetical protein